MLARRAGLADREDLEWDHSVWNCGRPDSDWRWLNEPEQVNRVYRHAHLFGGAIEFVDELAKLGDVVIITKRPRAAVNVTMEWLLFNRLPFSEVHVLADVPKSSVRPVCDAYIDDSPEVCGELHGATNARIILQDRPWNQDADPALFHARAMSFAQTLEIVARV